jgi:hypothetical protein
MSTPTPPTETPQVKAKDLHRIIFEALGFAGRDPTLPAVNAIYVESTSTHLVAVATDRFILGASATPYEGWPFEVAIALEYVPLLLKATAGRANRLAPVEVSVSPKGRRLKVDMSYGLGLSIPTMGDYDPERFPKWKTLLAEKRNVGSGTYFNTLINPAKLGAFTKLKADCLSIKAAAPNQPIMITARDDFIGLAMPIRSDSKPEWKDPPWLQVKK